MLESNCNFTLKNRRFSKMENCSFQTQLVAIMEVLAKAALAEINRRVEDSCAVLRLEISQSQRDIDALRKKCDQMEVELKRTKLRARRKGFYQPPTERCPPLVKSALSSERDTTVWDQQMDGGDHIQPQLGTDTDSVSNAEPMLIKEESAEENIWKHVPEEVLTSGSGHAPCFEETKPSPAESLLDNYSSAENPTIPGLLFPSVDSFDKSPELQTNDIQSDAGLIVKHEKEEDPSKSTAPIGSDHQFVIENDDRLLWSTSSSRDTGETIFSYATQQYEQIPSLNSCQSGLPMSHSTPDDVAPPINSLANSHSTLVSAAQVKKHTKTYGLKRLQPVHAPEEAHSTLTQIYSIDRSTLVQQPAQHQHSNSVPRARDEHKDLLGPNLATSSHSGYSRSNFSIARRIRTPWRSGVGEKRFGCSYCGKSFMRFSQLKEHLRSHTGEKPFSCLQCGRSFTKQCNLIRHAVVHSGEKPYECALCGKCFTQRSSLTSHQKTAH